MTQVPLADDALDHLMRRCLTGCPHCTGWRAQRAGLSHLALALWWGPAFALALRARPTGVRR